MINKNKIKDAIRKIGKRPSKEAVEKINKILKLEAERIINRAKLKADFSGRKTIISEDLEESV
ncbi:MAG: histone-like protein [Nanoarchaeota archaeon]